MKPIRSTHVPDTIQWYITGAFLAGATETKIASMTSLPRFTVHNTVSSFKKTGNPTIARRKRRKRSTKTDTLHGDNLTDKKGDYSDSSSEEYYDSDDDTDKETGIGIQELKRFKKLLYQDSCPSIKQEENTTAADAIDYILHKGRKYEEKHISPKWTSKRPKIYQEQYHHSDTIEGPTPTQTVDLQQTSDISPRSPSSFFTSDYHNNNNSAPRVNLWSRKDDKILLQHVLTRMGRWNELDQLFDGRHSSTDCMERWNILQHYLFKQLNKNGTIGW